MFVNKWSQVSYHHSGTGIFVPVLLVQKKNQKKSGIEKEGREEGKKRKKKKEILSDNILCYKASKCRCGFKSISSDC